MGANARELVLDILLGVERQEDLSHRLIESALRNYAQSGRNAQLEARERAFIKRAAEGTLERRLELDYYLDRYSSVPVEKMRPLIRCLMRMSAYQLLYMDAVPDSAACDEACRLAQKRGFGKLKGFVNGVLRNISRNKGNLPLPDRDREPLRYFSVRYSMPEWLVELWRGEYGPEAAEVLLGGLMEIRPLSVRFPIDMPPEERDRLCGAMRELGMKVGQSPYLPYVCLAEHTGGAESLPGFREGRCTVQDVSSALAVEAAGIGREDFVVDVCAAPGGKSILAAEKAASGRVLARDISEGKLARIRENAARMGIGNIDLQRFDGTETDEGLLGKADVVLLDVPCSGLGVIGKKRDIKYRVRPEDLAELEALQRKIVCASAGYVRPGGTLLYSTCTIHSGENQEMVRFLVRELGFEPVPLEGILPEALLAGKRQMAERLRAIGKGPVAELTEEEEASCVQILPGYAEADGFFIARFRRPALGKESGA